MGRKPVVLVVDDDTSVREALGRLLCREGYDVDLASGLTAARRFVALRRSALRVAIVDVGLGAENGIDLVRELRAWDTPPAILVFSAAPDAAARAEAQALGVDEFLAKPASPGIILASMRRILGSDARVGAAPAERRAVP